MENRFNSQFNSLNQVNRVDMLAIKKLYQKYFKFKKLNLIYLKLRLKKISQELALFKPTKSIAMTKTNKVM